MKQQSSTSTAIEQCHTFMYRVKSSSWQAMSGTSPPPLSIWFNASRLKKTSNEEPYIQQVPLQLSQDKP